MVQDMQHTKSESEVNITDTSSRATSSEDKGVESVISHPGSTIPPGRTTSTEDTPATTVSVTTTAIVMHAVAQLPPAPANSPATQSVVTDAVGMQHAVNHDLLQYRLERVEQEIEANNGERVGSSHFHEHSMWSSVAVEACEEGLKRLVTLAGDLNKVDDSMSVEAYYSKRLGEVIKAVGTGVDMEVLQKAMRGVEE